MIKKSLFKLCYNIEGKMFLELEMFLFYNEHVIEMNKIYPLLPPKDINKNSSKMGKF